MINQSKLLFALWKSLFSFENILLLLYKISMPTHAYDLILACILSRNIDYTSHIEALSSLYSYSFHFYHHFIPKISFFIIEKIFHSFFLLHIEIFASYLNAYTNKNCLLRLFWLLNGK